MARKKASREEIGRRRQQILKGARHCFARYGFSGTTVEALERACGVTRATLFKYFRNKEAMLEAVVAAEAVRRQARYEALQQSAPDALAAAVALQLQSAAEDADGTLLRLELILLAPRMPALRRPVSRMEKEEREWRKTLVRRAQEAGAIAAHWDVDEMTDLLSAVFLGLAAGRSLRLPCNTSDERLSELFGLTLGQALA